MDINYSNGFTQFGKGLQDALTRQEALRRQEEQDAIIKEREARLKAHDEAALAEAKARTAQMAAQHESEAAARKVAMASTVASKLPAGQSLDNMGEAANTLREGGLGDLMKDDANGPQSLASHSVAAPMIGLGQSAEAQAAAPVMAAQDDPSKALKTTFMGDARQQEEATHKKALIDMIASNPTLADNPNVKVAVQLAQATGDYAGLQAAVAKLLGGDDAKLGSFEDYVMRKYGKDPTPAQVTAARHEYGVADDRPFAPRFIVQPGVQPIIFNPNTQGVAPAIGSDGQPLTPTPTAEQVNAGTALQKANPVLAAIGELSEKINVNQGLYAKAAGAIEKQAAKVNLDDDVAEYEALVKSFTPLWARALGHTGVLTQTDVDSAREALPKPGDSKTLRDRKLARINSIISQMPRVDPTRGLPQPGGAPAAGGGRVRKYNPATRKLE